MRYLLGLLLTSTLLVHPAPAAARDKPLPWFGLRLGGLLATSSGAPGTPNAAGAGAYALFDGREFLADVMVDAFGGDHAQLFAAGLGAYYPFALQNVTPYAGGGLKLGWTKFGGDGSFGLIPYLGGGILFGREGYIQVRVELVWFLSGSSEENKAVPGSSWHSNGPMLTLGLGF